MLDRHGLDYFEWREDWHRLDCGGGDAGDGGRDCSSGEFVHGASGEVAEGADGGGSTVDKRLRSTVCGVQRNVSSRGAVICSVIPSPLRCVSLKRSEESAFCVREKRTADSSHRSPKAGDRVRNDSESAERLGDGE